MQRLVRPKRLRQSVSSGALEAKPCRASQADYNFDLPGYLKNHLYSSSPVSSCSTSCSSRCVRHLLFSQLHSRACPKLPSPSPSILLARSFSRQPTTRPKNHPSHRSPSVALVAQTSPADLAQNPRKPIRRVFLSTTTTMSGEAWLYLFAVLINAVNLFLQVFFTIMYSDLEWYAQCSGPVFVC
jgi:hypothetical protein